MTKVYDIFRRTAERTPEADFLLVERVTARAYGLEQGAISWRAAADEIERLRGLYAQAGYGHGHRVGLLLENRPAFFLHWLALNALGVSVVPIGIDLRSAELQYLIEHSGIVLAVSVEERIDLLGAAAEMAGRHLPTIGPDVSGPIPAPACAAPHADKPVDDGTECALLYTSGTTGRPKGCMLSNAYFIRCGQWYAELGGYCTIDPDRERILTPLPLTHMNAMAVSAMAIMTAGGCLIQLDRFHPSTWWESVVESRATIIHYLGVMPAMLLGAPESAQDCRHSVRWGFGAGVERQHHAVFEARFGFPLIEAWAMTETGAAACVMANHAPRIVGSGCLGRPEAYMEYRLVDDAGEDVADGTPGELLVRSAGADPRRGFFSGYLKDEAATAEAWHGGWFHTGDLVRRDEEGRLFFVDRKKNVIRRSGENISALEVESVLNEHPSVRTSAVAATPDPLRGDEVLACVVTRSAVRPEERAELAASIVRHSLSRLAYYKAPGYVAFVDALPLTGSQKIQRGKLRELAAEVRASDACIDTRRLKKRQEGAP